MRQSSTRQACRLVVLGLVSLLLLLGSTAAGSAAGTGTVRALVQYPDSGGAFRPLANVEVFLMDGGSPRHACTNGAGVATFNDVGVGQHIAATGPSRSDLHCANAEFLKPGTGLKLYAVSYNNHVGVGTWDNFSVAAGQTVDLQFRTGQPPADQDQVCGGVIPAMVGTDGPDVLIGTSGPDVISGGAGNDVIKGMGGDDTLCGGPGRDRLLGGRGSDLLFGEPGNDSLDGGPGLDLTTGGAGIDTCHGEVENLCELHIPLADGLRIIALWKAYNASWDDGLEAHAAFCAAHDYPDYPFNTAYYLTPLHEAGREDGFWVSQTPYLDSLHEEADWTIPSSFTLGGQVPRGRLYDGMVDVHWPWSSPGPTSFGPSVITIIGSEAYFVWPLPAFLEWAEEP